MEKNININKAFTIDPWLDHNKIQLLRVFLFNKMEALYFRHCYAGFYYTRGGNGGGH